MTVLSTAVAVSTDDVFSLLTVCELRVCAAPEEFVDAAFPTVFPCISAPAFAPGLVDLLTIAVAIAGCGGATVCCCCS